MKINIFTLLLMIVLGLGPGVGAGEIYQWVDKDGTLNFTDGPPPPGAEIVDGLSDGQSDEPRSTSPVDGGDPGATEDDDVAATEEGVPDPAGSDESEPIEAGVPEPPVGDGFGAAQDSVPGSANSNGLGITEDPGQNAAENMEQVATDEGDPGPIEGEGSDAVEGGQGRWRKW